MVGSEIQAELLTDYQISKTDAALLAECEVETFRSGGPGGQHANKVESGVRLTHIPTGIRVTSRDSRSQARNKQIALNRLRARLEEHLTPRKRRIGTKPSAASRRKRLEQKRQRSETKKMRRPPEI